MTPIVSAADEAFREQVRAWLAEHLVGEWASLKGLGGSGHGEHAYDERLAWNRHLAEYGWTCLGWPEKYGGHGLSLSQQVIFHEEYARADAPELVNHLGEQLLGPTLIEFGTDEQKERFLPGIRTVDELWCQGYSEPGAGSDLAAVSTRAALDEAAGEWVVDGQKVWTSSAHTARWAILIARTDPGLPKHQGITYFLCDMHAPGVEVRPLRQITGEAEFNEVFLTGVRIPDAHRLGAVGQGWAVARTTLMNERVSIGGMRIPREGGMIASVAAAWRERPELRTHALHHRLLELWVEAEVARLTGERLRQQLAAGQPGPEGSGMKLTFARLNQEISGLEVELLGEQGLLYEDWTMSRPELVDFTGRDAGYRYLRAKGNSIEGGTSEILLNIVAERVLGLPSEPRDDKDLAWKDLAR